MSQTSEPRTPAARATDDRSDDGELFGVLVTYRRPTQLAETLRRVAGQEVPLEALAVIDNGPDAASEAVTRGFAHLANRVLYVPTAENLGPAGGIALGMERVLDLAGDDAWLVLLDDDDPPLSPTWFRELLGFARSMASEDPRTGGVGFKGARFDWARGRLFPPRYDANAPTPVDYLASNTLPLYRVRAIRDVGTFRGPLFFGLDDLEFGLRLRRAGYGLYALPPHRAVIRRERPRVKPAGRNKGSRLRITHADWRDYYSLRNLLYIVRDHGHAGLSIRIVVTRGLLKPAANLIVSPRLAFRRLRLNLRACRDAWFGRMGRTIEPNPTPDRPEASAPS
jgi:rhamnopyranosyl-N-acetylglucosaminyl-diphospho-decaprenol beta-1,3/1,4-galactofuranosyltransferase